MIKSIVLNGLQNRFTKFKKGRFSPLNSFRSVGVGRFAKLFRALKILLCFSHFVNQLRWLTNKQINQSRLVNNFIMPRKFGTLGIFSTVLIALLIGNWSVNLLMRSAWKCMYVKIRTARKCFYCENGTEWKCICCENGKLWKFVIATERVNIAS